LFKIKFIISYDGSSYFGWQRQPYQVSVQETVENTLSKILNQKITIQGAGRTDRGVHAKGQVALFEIQDRPNLDSLQKSLNSLLPKDIRVLNMEEVDASFHPRFSAKGKVYTYKIITDKIQDPFLRHTTYHHPYPLSLERLQEAIPLFLGTKDFSSFANCVGKNSVEPSPIKTIYSIKLEKTDDGFTLKFHGDGFLYKMVRNLTGALISYGESRLSLEELEEILKKKDNRHRLMQAPAKGLCLEKVLYERSLS